MCSVKPQNDLSDKGRAVEEWLDLHFFRPIGIRIARALYPTGISPDQVTLWSLLIGLVAGHLFVYRDRWIDVIGFLLFIVSDVFDSADGRLAQLFPREGKLIRLLRAGAGGGSVPTAFREEYRERQEVLLPLCSWLGQNIRFLLLGAAAIAGHISAFLWAEAVPMSLLLVVL